MGLFSLVYQNERIQRWDKRLDVPTSGLGLSCWIISGLKRYKTASLLPNKLPKIDDCDKNKVKFMIPPMNDH